MSKAAFDKIAAGLEAAIDFAEGRGDPASYRVHTPAIAIASIRDRLGLSISEFAHRYGFPEGDVRDWEAGVSRPEGAANSYLTVIAREPEAVERALELPSKTAA